MSLHIVIDGYNLIRQSKWFSAFEQEDIQQGREALVKALADYKKIKAYKITVVFDGMNAPDFLERRDQIRGVRVRFSKQGELADTVIKRIVAREREKAMVVTSDHEIVNYASSRGAACISSPEFEEKLTMAAYMATKGISGQTDEYAGWEPTTKKKGPRKRMAKKNRRNRIKIDKL